VVEVYPHTKLDGNRKVFVDIHTDGWTDTPQFQSTRSSVGDDLKIGLWQAVVQVPYYCHQPSVLNCTRKWRRT